MAVPTAAQVQRRCIDGTAARVLPLQHESSHSVWNNLVDDMVVRGWGRALDDEVLPVIRRLARGAAP